MPTLKHLDLGLNKLSALPAQLLLCVPNLEHLFIDCNQIEYLPPELAELNNLRVVHLQSNHFSYVPASLFFTRTLKEIGLEWF